jgi:sortase A
VTKARRPEDLSVDELRTMLLEKRRLSRQQRLDRFRRTGRAVTLSPDLPPAALDDLRTTSPDAGQESGGLLDDITDKPQPRSRRWTDRVLLAIEILAIIGLAAILFNGMGILQTLNQEVAAALQQPTLSPTPIITAVVLPGGHKPADASGVVQPNQAEIPEHLLPLVQSLANLPVPTPGPEQAVRIQIPAINVDAPVVQGDGWDQLKKGVGQHIGSANPGQIGNLVLSGHNDVFGEIFRYIDQLQPGDLVLIYTNQRQFVYVVTDSQVVLPTQVDVMNSTPDATVTLITCTPFRVDNKRYVVFAKLQSP